MPPRYRRLSASDKRRIIRLRAEGWTYRQIATILGCSPAAASYHARSAGIRGRLRTEKSDPTPEEIRTRAAKIRDGWPAYRRREYEPPEWTPPTVSARELGIEDDEQV